MDTRGLLVMYQMGGGKSHLAVHIAIENMSGQSGRGVIMLQSKSLEANMRGAIEKYIKIRTAEEPDFYLARLPPADLSAWIDRNFTFVSANASNMIDQLARKTQDDMFGNISRLSTLDGKLLIVDEAHNLFRSITNGGKNALALYDLIMRSSNLKCVFLTGTPIANDVFEIVPCFNMLGSMRPKTPILPETYREFYTLYVDKAAKKMKSRGHLQNRLLGLISSFSHSNPPVAGQSQPAEFPEQKPTVMRFVHMSRDQYVAYNLARDKEAMEGMGRKGGPAQEPAAMTKPRSKSSSTYRVRSRQLSNVAFAVEGEQSRAPTDEEAPKFAQMYADIENHRGQLGLAYSQFTGAGGLKSFEAYLQARGWRRYEISLVPRRGGSQSTLTPSEFVEIVERQVAAYGGSHVVGGSHFVGGSHVSSSDSESVPSNPSFTVHARYATDADTAAIKLVFPEYEPASENIVITEDDQVVGYVTKDTLGEILKTRGAHADLVARASQSVKFGHAKTLAAKLLVPHTDFEPMQPINMFTISGGDPTDINAILSESSTREPEIDPEIEAAAAQIDVSELADSYKPSRQRYYCVISGEVDPSIRAELQAVFNNDANAHGEIIDLILTSSTGAEGLDLKRLRYVMMMEAYWNPSREKQLFARGVRNDSHKDMPEAEKNVTPYVYLAIPPLDETLPGKAVREIKTITDVVETYTPTTDIELYTESVAGEELIKDCIGLLNEISIECTLLTDTSSCRMCSPTDEPLWTDDPARDSTRVDPCRPATSVTVRAKPIMVDGIMYQYSVSTGVFGWTVYEFADDIKAWVAMPESDARFMTVIAAIEMEEGSE